MSLGEEIYTGAYDFGALMSALVAGFTTIVVAVVVLLCVSAIRKGTPHTESAAAVIMDSSCALISETGLYTCDLDLSFAFPSGNSGTFAA